jgi:two-component system, CitB family, sensor kinase
MPVRFQTQLIVFIGTLVLCVTGILVGVFQYMTATTLKQQIGERALDIADTVAMIPDIRQAFSQPDPSKTIDPIAEAIRKKTGAEFASWEIGREFGILIPSLTKLVKRWKAEMSVPYYKDTP